METHAFVSVDVTRCFCVSVTVLNTGPKRLPVGDTVNRIIYSLPCLRVRLSLQQIANSSLWPTVPSSLVCGLYMCVFVFVQESVQFIVIAHVLNKTNWVNRCINYFFMEIPFIVSDYSHNLYTIRYIYIHTSTWKYV